MGRRRIEDDQDDVGTSYQPHRRKCDPTGYCGHGFEIRKPCIPCDRIGDASCPKCYDIGFVVLKNNVVQCKCVTNPKDRAR